jgi:hypothetical protein
MDNYWAHVDHLASAIGRSKAVNVNSASLREEAADIAQRWFREERPTCIQTGMAEEELNELDAENHRLLRLSNGLNSKRSYSRVLKTLRQVRPEIQGRRHILEGQRRNANHAPHTTPLETGIIVTLERMLPHTMLSYRQVIADLAGPARFSYRGTATELREVVREVLDHLAPDGDVMKAPGFKLEKDRLGPTMKQKARFILKARGVGDSSRTAPEQSVELLEDQTASLARSVYERGSASTHAATLKAQVLSFKGYADAVLAELLQLHR